VNAIGARKGKDSVTFGIDWLKQQTIILDKSCINMRNELQQYHWKKDAGGNSMKIPVDKNNHLVDSIRYAYENDMEPIGFFA
jgi:phage terminase large subunit